MCCLYVGGISTSLGKAAPPKGLSNEKARDIEEGDPLQWLSSNTEMGDIIQHVQKKNLSNYVIEYIKENSLDEETDCVQLLICKLSPFIQGMQKSLENQSKGDELDGKHLLLKYMPSIEEVTETGDKCEDKHRYCRLVY